MTPRETGFKCPDAAQFSPMAYIGDTPERRDIIEGRLPRGKVVILAGEGDVGKSWLLLEMHRAINDNAADFVFGGRVMSSYSPCIFLSGEDDRSTLDLRLKTIRHGSKVKPQLHGLLIPSPDLGHMPLVVKDAMGDIVTTDVYGWLDEQLTLQRGSDPTRELGFLAIDTWSTYFPIDANNNAEVHAAIAYMTALATKHDICIVITHHVAKHSEPGTRASIRGATAMVDGSRAAYTFFRVPEPEALFVHDHLPEDIFRGEVIRLQIVKNNLGLRRDPVTYVRQEDGRLLDVSDLLRDQTSPEDALVSVITGYNAEGVRVMKSGKNGLYNLKAPDWPPCLYRLGKHKLDSLLSAQIARGRIMQDAKIGLVAVQ